MSNTELDPRVLRLWDQLRYAYEHGGGHSGHLNNALHTAKAVSKELCKAESERDALKDHVHRLESLCHDMAGELTVLRATKQMTAAIDAARGE